MKRVSALLIVASLIGILIGSMNPVAAATNTVTIGTQSRSLTGTNVTRGTDALVMYTPAWGASTRTNVYGFEASVVGGKVVTIANSVGNMAIPSNGYVLSGHGTARTWLQANATVGATVTIGDAPPPPPPPPTGSSVIIGSQSHVIDGVDVFRDTGLLIQYTGASGASTGTNPYGYEAAVSGGKVTKVENGIGNMTIPAGGYVLSGHGDARTWLQINATVGATVTLGNAPPPTAGELLPDVGVQTLGGFLITTVNGKKLLKFPGVTANVGKGPAEIKGTRASTTSTDWTATQVIYNSDGSKTSRVAPGLTFYYAGDGHSHWHMRDFDAYELFNGGGTKLRDGEKHGFCFEDNTKYRDWPGRVAGSPANPVYTHAASCGQGLPNATTVTHGLSVGWGDTYPTTLPDQAIDITGLADGVYTVKLTADQGGWVKESNESNNTASAQIRISGSTVTLMSTSGGL